MLVFMSLNAGQSVGGNLANKDLEWSCREKNCKGIQTMKEIFTLWHEVSPNCSVKLLTPSPRCDMSLHAVVPFVLQGYRRC